MKLVILCYYHPVGRADLINQTLLSILQCMVFKGQTYIYWVAVQITAEHCKGKEVKSDDWILFCSSFLDIPDDFIPYFLWQTNSLFVYWCAFIEICDLNFGLQEVKHILGPFFNHFQLHFFYCNKCNTKRSLIVRTTSRLYYIYFLSSLAIRCVVVNIIFVINIVVIV